MRYHQAWVVALGALLAAAPAAAEPGVTDTEILIGGSNSFSGPLAFTGEQITKGGVELYLRVVNDAGGIHDKCYSPKRCLLLSHQPTLISSVNCQAAEGVSLLRRAMASTRSQVRNH